MNRVEINGLNFLQWDVSDEYMQELITWLNENAKKIPDQEIGSIPTNQLKVKVNGNNIPFHNIIADPRVPNL